MHLADLALVFVNVFDRHTECGSSIDLVDVLPSAEQFELVAAAQRKPRVDARFNGRPIGCDELLTVSRDQRRAQHTF